MNLLATGFDVAQLAVLTGIFYRMGGLVATVAALKDALAALRARVVNLETYQRKETSNG